MTDITFPEAKKSGLLREFIHEDLGGSGCTFYVFRDDLSDPFLGGNKMRKLKYNLEAFYKSGKKTILSFGGKYSNHLVALAAAGHRYGFQTIGILRGEEETNNEYSNFMKRCGMKLFPVDRATYRLRNEEDGNEQVVKAAFQQAGLKVPDFSELFILPEGGSNELAKKGCSEIPAETGIAFDYICCACGTGTTFSGIAEGLNDAQTVIGIPVLRNLNLLPDDLTKTGNVENKILFHDYHFGGYAKTPDSLCDFTQKLNDSNQLAIEPVYTGKLFFAVLDLAKKKYFPKGSVVIIYHSGGVFNFHDQN